MYTFVDHLNGESLTLRPEGTASCVRAVLQHNLLYAGPQRLYYTGPMFRHERPQKGRYRQFHQVGVEALGLSGPGRGRRAHRACARACGSGSGLDGHPPADQHAGQPGVARALPRAVGEVPRAALRRAGRGRQAARCTPIRCACWTARIRRCRRSSRARRACTTTSTRTRSGTSRSCRRSCASLGLDYEIKPRLVRGLDYYNHTVFEWTDRAAGRAGRGVRRRPLRRTDRAARRQACAGLRLRDGRGAAAGADERVPAGLRRRLPAGRVSRVSAARAWMLHAWRRRRRLRDAGLTVVLHCGGGSFKSQMRRADASGARLRRDRGRGRGGRRAGRGQAAARAGRAGERQRGACGADGPRSQTSARSARNRGT